MVVVVSATALMIMGVRAALRVAVRVAVPLVMMAVTPLVAERVSHPPGHLRNALPHRSRTIEQRPALTLAHRRDQNHPE